MDEWQKAGVWERLHEVLLARLRAAGRSSGRGRWLTRVMCKRKGAPRRGRARLIEPETAPIITSSSTRRGSRSPGRSRAATVTTSPS
jgi:hypothetical protein